VTFSRRLQSALRNHGEAARFRLLTACANVLIPGYRLKFPQLDWWQNSDFNAYLAKFDEHDGHNTDRRWLVYQLQRLTAGVPGDTAECGAFNGAGSYIILKSNQQDRRYQRTHFVFDSFEGLSIPQSTDGDYWRAGDMSVGESKVRDNLADCGAFELMKGWIPARFAEVADRRFAFVHIDVDLYEPTRDSLAFFLPRMAAGGVIVCDDYGFSTCPGATLAVDEVLAGCVEKMLPMPDGGGFLIKGVSTGKTAQLSVAVTNGDAVAT